MSRPDIDALKKISAEMKEKVLEEDVFNGRDVLRWADAIETIVEGDGYCTWRRVSDWAQWYTDCDKYDYGDAAPKTCTYCKRKVMKFP